MTDENIHIGALLKEYFKYWKIYVPIGIICLIGSIVFILITPKEYKITAQMQLRNEAITDIALTIVEATDILNWLLWLYLELLLRALLGSTYTISFCCK